MKLEIFADPVMGQNTYVYYDENIRRGVVIDPGLDGKRALDFVESQGLQLDGVLLTHAHADHISTLDLFLSGPVRPQLLVHQEDAPMLLDSRLNLSEMLFYKAFSFQADRLLQDGDQVQAGQAVLTVIHTPGHSPGGVCFFDPLEKIIFTGDTLFYHSIGRTDFELGDGPLLIQSIQNRLFTMEGDVGIYPGHGQASTVEEERKHNPFAGQI